MHTCSKCYYKLSVFKPEPIDTKGKTNILHFNPLRYNNLDDMIRDFKIFQSFCSDYLTYYENKDYTIINRMIWYIATPIKKHSFKAHSALLFFYCLEKCLDHELFYTMLTQGLKDNKKWTALHDLFFECKEINEKVKTLSNLLINMGLSLDAEDDYGITPNSIMKKKLLMTKTKEKVSNITYEYKTIEKTFINQIMKEYPSQFICCIKCGDMINYLYSLNTLANYLNQNSYVKNNFIMKHGYNIHKIIRLREKATEEYKSSEEEDDDDSLQSLNQSIRSHDHVINLYKNLI